VHRPADEAEEDCEQGELHRDERPRVLLQEPEGPACAIHAAMVRPRWHAL